MLGQLRHPNICLLLGYSLAEESEVMIVELMRCSLVDVLKTTHVAMPRGRSLRYAIQFAQGMNYLHTCKPPILHRDLKPANLLISFADVLKVSDFGLAKLQPLDEIVGDEPSAQRFMTGETGSYRFMAPEVFKHEKYDERVDCYSFSMILFYMISGEPPWPHLSGLEACSRAALESDRPTLPRHWDVKLTQLMRGCWAPDPSARPSFAAILEVLNEVFKQTTGASYEDTTSGGVGAKGCCTVS